MYIDTLRTYDRLHNAGMPAEQARMFVEILSELVVGLLVEREHRAATPLLADVEKHVNALQAESEIRAAAENRAHEEEIARIKAATARKQWWTKVIITAYTGAMAICLALLIFIPSR